MSNIEQIFPANDFKVVLENAKADAAMGLILGLDEDGYPVMYAGGLINGRQPVAKDWLWLIEDFKRDLMAGVYNV